MTQKKINLIKTSLVLALSFSCIFRTGVIGDVKEKVFNPKNELPVLPVEQEIKIPKYERLRPFNNFLLRMRGISFTVTIINKESLGWYFITSYCPVECGGSWQTASGETCHRADWEDRLYKPTTCAIDRSIHSFGDLFYIEEFDRVFIAEDTGSAVLGKHLDLFYEDYDDVLSFPTGWYEVFSVSYEEVECSLG